MEQIDESLLTPEVWPVDPQEAIPLDEGRIWVDGCFDFTHHGHAGAMLQARRLGSELYVGVHSDEAILENKGPTVMTLEERVATVAANRWTTKVVPHAPYITSLPWITHYGCQYVVHGDDITSDASGQDCYRFVKAAERFKVVKRTPGISTTDLVGRMLLYSKSHFVKNVEDVLRGREGHGNHEERKNGGDDLLMRLKDYATDESGLKPGCDVWIWKSSHPPPPNDTTGPTETTTTTATITASGHTEIIHRVHAHHAITQLVEGKGPRHDQRIVYVDGGFDLFSPGHIEFLKQVCEREEREAKIRGWYDEKAQEARVQQTGEDYRPCYLIVGVHDDAVINHWKGLNYPIMNIFERGLCVLQCKYTDLVLFSAPYVPTVSFLSALPYTRVSIGNSMALPDAVYHGPTTFMHTHVDPYEASKNLGIFRPVSPHKHQDLNAGTIVERILASRGQYEERQRIKGFKALDENTLRQNESN